MNQEQQNQEREYIDKKFKSMFATTKALKEKGSSALDISPRQSRISKWIDRICLTGGILMSGWLIFVIAYGIWEYIVKLFAISLLILLYWIIYRIGDEFGWWDKTNPY